MRNITKKRKPQGVALHPEGVDRNLSEDGVYNLVAKVALHPEGVDRNANAIAFIPNTPTVALHPEGVDRNL